MSYGPARGGDVSAVTRHTPPYRSSWDLSSVLQTGRSIFSSLSNLTGFFSGETSPSDETTQQSDSQLPSSNNETNQVASTTSTSNTETSNSVLNTSALNSGLKPSAPHNGQADFPTPRHPLYALQASHNPGASRGNN